MRRDWMTTGDAVLRKGWEHETSTEVTYTEIPRSRVEQAIDEMRWEPVRDQHGQTRQFAMSPALGIQACIEQMGIPRVARIAISHDLAPYGLYGIEGNYRDCRAQVFVLDRGHDLTTICVDVTSIDELHEEALAEDWYHADCPPVAV